MSLLDKIVMTCVITGAITLLTLSIWAVVFSVKLALCDKQIQEPRPSLVLIGGKYA